MSSVDSNQSNEIAAALLQNPTHDTVALAFATQNQHKLIYVPQIKRWHIWSGDTGVWVEDDMGYVTDEVRKFCRQNNRDGRKTLGKRSFIDDVEKLCRADQHHFVVNMDRLNGNSNVLNTRAGIVNLRIGDIAPHDPFSYCTKSSPFRPSTEHDNVFLRFLSDITIDDAELQEFLQISLGSFLSGALEGHAIYFWIGNGRNGKNTLGDLIMNVMGSYAKKIPSSVLLSQYGSEHPTSIANLRGCRLAISSELPDGSFFDEAKIKELTGDEILSARYMRGNYFEFPRTHKHLVYGNHRPQIRTVDDGIKSRMRMVPFNASFKDAEDPELPKKLRKESDFILQWLIEGHLKWRENGFKVPPCAAVEGYTTEYFASQSTPEMWLEERCNVMRDDGRASTEWPKASRLYEDYSGWKRSRGETPISSQRLSEFLVSRFEKKVSAGIRYVGLQLKVVGL